MNIPYCVHKTTTIPYIDPDEFNQHSHILFKYILILSYLQQGLPCGPFPGDFFDISLCAT
jgi:hypothetical protein